MSKLVANEFSEAHSGQHPHDLLARLYREIGLSAVAAALDVMRTPEPVEPATLEPHPLPAVLEDSLAA
jgi:hypothetical protein